MDEQVIMPYPWFEFVRLAFLALSALAASTLVLLAIGWLCGRIANLRRRVRGSAA